MIDVGENAFFSASPDHEIVRFEPITPHRDEKQQCRQDAQVPANPRAHTDSSALPTEPGREGVQRHYYDRNADDQQRGPRIDRLLERKPRRVEREIVLEVWIALAKAGAETRERERGPAWQRGGHRCRDKY